MKSRIIYFLGAGASCGEYRSNETDFPYEGSRIPLVSQFENAARSIPIILNSASGRNVGPATEYIKFKQNERFWHSWNLVCNEIRDSFSPDTVARIYELQGQKESYLSSLNLIGLVIDYYQRLNGLDKRYDVFLSSIAKVEKEGVVFPENLTVYTWNYDLQFEMYLYKLFHNRDNVDFETFRYNSLGPNQFAPDNFSLIKLNGDIRSTRIDIARQLKGPISNPAETILTIASDLYKTGSLSDLIYDSLDFGWGRNALNLISRNAEPLKEAKELVVIGYSFPAFNREVDNYLLNEFARTAGMNGKRIVVQCGGASDEIAEKLNERLISMNPEYDEVVDIVPYSSTREFYFSNLI